MTKGDSNLRGSWVPIDQSVEVVVKDGDNNNDDCAGTAALLKALIPMVMPLVCRQVSQGMLEGMAILLNEEEVPKDSKGVEIIKDIQLQLDSISLVSPSSLKKDMDQMPKFAWPEQDRATQLMQDQRMTVLDIQDMILTILLGAGIEFEFPAVSTLGQKVNLEVGCGGKKIGDDAYFQLHLPKVRLWIVLNEQVIQPPATKKHVYTKVYVAIIGRPNLTPNVHINADRGKGDFFEMDLDEEGSLDDVVENVLLGFGPSEFQQQQDDDNKKKKKKIKQSWVGNALGKQIQKAMAKYVGLGGDKPYEVDLTESITNSIEGKPRQLYEIEADLERLQQELEVAQQYYAGHPDEVKQAPEEEKEEKKK